VKADWMPPETDLKDDAQQSGRTLRRETIGF